MQYQQPQQHQPIINITTVRHDQQQQQQMLTQVRPVHVCISPGHIGKSKKHSGYCPNTFSASPTASKSSEAWRQTTLDFGIAFLALVAFVSQQTGPQPHRLRRPAQALWPSPGPAESSVFGPCRSAQHVLAPSQGRFVNCSMHARKEMRAPLGFQHASLVAPRDVRPARD